MATNENQTGENITAQSTDTGPSLLRGQFSRPTLLFKARAPKFSTGKINYFLSLIDYCYDRIK